jgi:transcriptional regulator with XRE-family HTH domain
VRKSKTAGKTAPKGDDVTPLLGARLRALRVERELGLRETARRAGISHGSLSQIETGRMRPSVATLARISSVLGVPMFDDLFPPPEPPQGSKKVVRRSARRALAAYSPPREWLLTPEGSASFVVTLTTIEPGASSGGYYSHSGGQEFLFLISGELEFGIADKTWKLKAGDAVTFQASDIHRWRNRSGKPAEALWVLEHAHAADGGGLPHEHASS